MTPEAMIQLLGEGFMLTVLMVAVLVLPSLVVGLVVSVFQAATQINEQTLSFLPRLLTTLLSLMVAGPWLLARLLDFTRRVVESLPLVTG
ncbi:MAG: flagellar biosynthesis protein FliQ [Pseudomonadales bacterium]|jgi:flagellar biosynthetic protein FliQ|nr:flagellar biosynthesis protein FliQ [Pseudomonadales bacterium]MCP5336839.1 flagellar biosynthesis protein FliQ [Pseudomonadales bacterium]